MTRVVSDANLHTYLVRQSLQIMFEDIGMGRVAPTTVAQP